MWVFGIVACLYSLTVYGEDECEQGKYGDGCNLDCPEHCLVRPQNSLHCNKENGACYEGCDVGFYGDRCNHHCSGNCERHTCNQHNGHCSWGCAGNRIGDFCESIPDTTFNSQTTETTGVAPTTRSTGENVGIQVIIPVVAVIVLVLAGMVCTVIFVMRCRKRGLRDLEVGQTLLPVSATNTSNLNDKRREDSILHNACRKGTLANVRHIISEGRVDINSRGKDGQTPVMTAAKRGRRELVDLLVREQCDLSLTDDDGNTILHVASVAGHVKIVRYVLSKKVVDVNRSGHCNRTPVMAAARFKHKKVFDLLVKNGSDLTHVDSDGNNILHIACIGGHMEIVRYVLNKARVDINSRGHNGMTPVMLAAYFGHQHLFQLLVKNECILPILDDNGTNILHVACVGKNVDIVKHILMKNPVSINSKDNTGKTPVMLAAEFGHTTVFKLLVNNQCDTKQVCDKGNNILHMSCALGHVEIVKYILLERSIDVDSCGQNQMTPVMFAAKNGQRDIFELLVENGCDLSRVDKDGGTVLHMACIGGNQDIVNVFLSKEIVDINSRGQFKRTPVMVAAVGGHKAVFDSLVNRGADLTLVDVDGLGIRHLTCMSGHLHMVVHVQNICGCA